MKPGQRVKSKRIGCVGPFVGVIVATFGRGRKRYYHIQRASDGVLWHRDAPDIKPVTPRGKHRATIRRD